MEGFQQAADYYAAEDATSQQSQCLLKVAGFAAQTLDYKKAIELYEQVAMTSLESTLLKWSVKDYYLRAGICHLATVTPTGRRELILAMRSATQPSRALARAHSEADRAGVPLPPVSPASTQGAAHLPLRSATTRARDAGVRRPRRRAIHRPRPGV